MPILDRRNNQLIEDKDTRVSVGIDFPFARIPNQDGYFATTKTTIESVKNNIRLLLQTQKEVKGCFNLTWVWVFVSFYLNKLQRTLKFKLKMILWIPLRLGCLL